jgi:hypothetical protein
MCNFGREREESLELHRDEDPTNVGEEVGSDGDDNADCVGVGNECSFDCREASSTTDL